MHHAQRCDFEALPLEAVEPCPLFGQRASSHAPTLQKKLLLLRYGAYFSPLGESVGYLPLEHRPQTLKPPGPRFYPRSP